jgi:hypothetical protein
VTIISDSTPEAPTHPSAAPSRFSAVLSAVPLIALAVWVAFYVPRIWAFGFYADDWVQLVYIGHAEVADQWSAWWQLASIRPVAVFLIPIFARVLGPHPALWQAVSALVALASTLLLYRVLHRIGDEPRSRYDLTADLVTAGWLLMPWSVASSAWAALLGQAQVSQMLFLASFAVASRPSLGKLGALGSALLYLGSLFAYESFYGGFLLITYFCSVRPYLGGRSSRRRTSLWLGGALLAAQLLAVAYNRLLATLNFAGSKAWNPGWFEGVLGVATSLPERLCQTGEACQFSPETVRSIAQASVGGGICRPSFGRAMR